MSNLHRLRIIFNIALILEIISFFLKKIWDISFFQEYLEGLIIPIIAFLMNNSQKPLEEERNRNSNLNLNSPVDMYENPNRDNPQNTGAISQANIHRNGNSNDLTLERNEDIEPRLSRDDNKKKKLKKLEKINKKY